MGIEFLRSRHQIGLVAAQSDVDATCLALHARFDLSDEDAAIEAVEIRGGVALDPVHWRELRLRNRLRHQHKGAERRLVEIGPLNLRLQDGPADILVQCQGKAPRRLARVDLPGMAAQRFREWLGRELTGNLATHKTRRRLRALVAGFAEVPADQGDAHWLEAEIALNVLQKIKPTRTHARVAQLKALREGAGQGDAFTAFLALLTETNGLRLPTFHGYGKTFAERDAAAVLAEVGRLMDRLTAIGLTVFANSGTLLGLVREGRLLGHDDDIDLAVVLQAHSPEAAAVEWLALRHRLDDLDMIDRKETKAGSAIIKLLRLDGVTVDLFPCWIDAGFNAHIYPHTKGDLAQTAILPLVEGFAQGIRLPADPEAMLAVNYGSNWRLPDPTFRFPWDEAHAHFHPFTAVLAAGKD